MTKWDRRFLKLAHHIAKWSKDPSTKVGAIVVGPNKEIRSQGFNGFPRGVLDSEARYSDRAIKYKIVVHAEMNACLHAARIGASLEGCTIYITMFPCVSCAGAIIQSGISEVVVPDVPVPERWSEEAKLSQEILDEANIVLRRI